MNVGGIGMLVEMQDLLPPVDSVGAKGCFELNLLFKQDANALL